MIKKIDAIISPILLFGLGLTLLLPIYIDSSFFFPYISPKAIVFRGIMEILVVLWLIAVAWGQGLKWKIDWLTILFAAYLVVMYLASILGPDFHFSFWSYVERSEGLLLWTHLFIFFLILRNAISSRRQWNILFEILFFAAQVVAVIGLLQYFGVDFINKAGDGEARVASTIGNASFLAGYLLFSVFIGAYLATQKKEKFMRYIWWIVPLITAFFFLYRTGPRGAIGFVIYGLIAAISCLIIAWKARRQFWLLYYILGIGLEIFVMFQTGTRGAMLGLIGAAILFVLYNIIFGGLKQYRVAIMSAGAILLLLGGIIFANKNATWVTNSLALKRLTSISLSDNTATARLMTWGSAWQGFKERPLLGYGQENFYLVFNKYFNPKIYVHSNSRIWYDRAHNIFIDHAITGGIIGLGLFIIFLLYPLIIFFRSIRRSDLQSGERFGLQMLALALVAFIIQGLFVFESLVVYFALLMIIAFSGSLVTSGLSYVVPKRIGMLVAILSVLVFLPAFYFFNVKETQANLQVIGAIQYQANPIVAYNIYTKAIDAGTSGTQEYRRRLGEFVDGLVVNRQISPDQAKIYVQRVDEELDKRIVENPADVANYIMFMRHLNTTYVLDPTRLYRVEPLAEQALKYSATRPQIYYEVGYAQYYLSEYYKDQKLDAERKQALTKMEEAFQKAIDLNPQVKESYINMIMTLLAGGESSKVQKYFDEMDKRNINYKDADSLRRIANSAASAKNYQYAAQTYSWLTELYPDNPENFIQAAVSFACNKQNDRAIELAEKAKKFGGDYLTQSEDFISRLRSKTFNVETSCQ